MKFKVFHGWWIVLSGMMLSAYYSAILGYGWTGFVTPIIATFGWSLTEVSFASSLRSMEAGVFNPIWGAAVDRWSPGKLMVLGVFCTGLGMLCLSLTRNLAMYYGGFLAVGVGSSLVTSILPIAVISRWFKKGIGRASGVFYLGPGIGGALVPLVVKLIDSIGWQKTLLYTTFGFMALGIPLSLVFRGRPEDYEPVPDGREVAPAGVSRHRRVAEVSASVSEALRTRVFWTVGFSIFFHFIAASTLNLYVVPYLTSLGISRLTASTVVALYNMVSLFTRILMGLLADYFRNSYIMALGQALQSAGLIMLWLISGTSPYTLILLFGIVYGLGLGGASPLRATIIAEYFGTKKFGTIFGLSMVFMTVGSVVSPPLAGWLIDTYHDYKFWWLITIVANLVCVAMVLTMPAPGKKPVAVKEPAVTEKTEGN
ncbi:MAG: MFS transporter [Chloroflexota bacterium]